MQSTVTKDQLARALGQRESAEQLATAIRQNLAGWRKEEAARGPVARALLWASNEAWIARIESLAASIEQHVSSLRTQETTLAAATVAEASTPKRASRRKAKGRGR